MTNGAYGLAPVEKVGYKSNCLGLNTKLLGIWLTARQYKPVVLGRLRFIQSPVDLRILTPSR